MKEIDVFELKKMKDENQEFQLIDVREDVEFQFSNLGGEHISLDTVANNLDKISENKPKIIMCRSGKRSAFITELLTQNGFEEVFNLKGGIMEWAAKIDPNLQVN